MNFMNIFVCISIHILMLKSCIKEKRNHIFQSYVIVRNIGARAHIDVMSEPSKCRPLLDELCLNQPAFDSNIVGVVIATVISLEKL